MFFKDTYFSVFVRPEDRKWLQFMWKNQVFQFTCLPQGLSSAPRIFTKLLKPVFSHLRKLGIAVSCYIDDCIFLTTSEKELLENVRYALRLFDELGLTVSVRKSVQVSTQVVEFTRHAKFKTSSWLPTVDGRKITVWLLLLGAEMQYSVSLFLLPSPKVARMLPFKENGRFFQND